MGANTKKKTNMKTENLSYILIATVLLAVTWLVSGIRMSVDPGLVLGIASVVTILGMVVIDYGNSRIKWLENK